MDNLERFGQPFVRVVKQGDGDFLMLDPSLVTVGQQQVASGTKTLDQAAEEIAMAAVLEPYQGDGPRTLRALAEQLPLGPFRTGFNRGADALTRVTLLAFKAAAAVVPLDITPDMVPAMIDQVGATLEKAILALYPKPLAAVYTNGGIVGAYYATKQLKSLGGPGSGHFGHVGRPGHVGGSAPGNQISNATEAGDEPMPNWISPTAPPKKGDSLTVFRIEYAKDAGLQGRNAGNAEAIAAHLLNHDEYGEADMGSILTAYQVTLTEDMQEGYISLHGGEAKLGEELETAVARGGYFIGQGYAFPKSGKGFVASPLSSVPISEIAREGGPLGIAAHIRKTFSKVRQLGGEGSGNFDHAGRPGKVGGSAPSVFKYIKVKPSTDLYEKYLASAQAPALTEAEFHVVRNYMDGHYVAINQPLIHGDFDLSKKKTQNFMSAIQEMDSAIEKMPVVTGLVVRFEHGLFEDSPEQAFVASLTPGQVFERSTYVSASSKLDINVKRDMAGLFSDDDPRIKYVIRSKSARNVSHEFLASRPTEQEVIFPRGAQFRVDKIEVTAPAKKGGWFQTFGPHKTVYLTEVGTPKKHLKGLEEFRTLWPNKDGHDDHGRPHSENHQSTPALRETPITPKTLTPGSPEWFAQVKKTGGPKGSNDGGVYQDASGQKWYVKKYKDPEQAASEHIANQVYGALGAQVPETFLGEGGVIASKWMTDGGPTLSQAGLKKETADQILDHFVADVLVANWDTVGTGHDNILVGASKVTRVDQGGTLLHRAQGALKPASLLHGIGEWDTLPSPSTNIWYARVFKAAGLSRADDLGARAVRQIDAIETVRNKAGGWAAFLKSRAPNASSTFIAKAAAILESRTNALLAKRDALKHLKGLEGELKALAPKKKVATDVKITFDDVNDFAADWANEHTAELAKGLSETTKKRIKAALVDSFTTLDYPKPTVYQQVLDAVKDKKRAETIAHHESMIAMSEGQRAAWAQAQAKGLLGPDARRRWVAAMPGACELCEALDSRTAPLNGPYALDGADGPPRHVNCRCTESIYFPGMDD